MDEPVQPSYQPHGITGPWRKVSMSSSSADASKAPGDEGTDLRMKITENLII